jgi:DNA-binding NtrC family response regulator
MKTILLIDDDVAVLRATARALRSDRYEIIRASSFSEAMKLLESNYFSLVISDHNLDGGFTSEDIAEEICIENGIDLIVYTGNPDAVTFTSCVVSKPNIGELLDKVEEILLEQDVWR